LAEGRFVSSSSSVSPESAGTGASRRTPFSGERDDAHAGLIAKSGNLRPTLKPSLASVRRNHQWTV
jgi:hypothetical protein